MGSGIALAMANELSCPSLGPRIFHILTVIMLNQIVSFHLSLPTSHFLLYMYLSNKAAAGK